MRVEANKIKNLSIHLLAIAIITVSCCIHIKIMNYIFVISDEFGYWAHAISAVGYDWRELISETSYYTWGYSIWLIPIIAILPSPEAWYKAAICLNVLFLILSYFLCYQSGRKLFRELDERLVALVSIIVIIYPSNIVYAEAAWTENLSYLLVWLVTYLIICLDEKFSNKYFICAALVLVYSYAVHNRNIGVVLAGMAALCLVLLKHKKRWLYFPVLCLIMLAGYEGVALVKNHQILSLWSNSKASDMNNVSLDVATITSYSSRLFEQTGDFLISLFGKYIYLLIGTGLTLPIVICKALKDVIKNVKDRKWWRDYQISRIWILLVLIAMYGICAIQMNLWEVRADFVVYARYMENALGPAAFLAIMYYIVYSREARIGLLISAVSLLVGIVPVYYWITHSAGGFNTICSPVVGGFFEAVRRNSRINELVLLAAALAIAFVVLFAMTYCERKALVASIVLAGFGVAYCMLGYYGRQDLVGAREIADGATVPLYNKIGGDLEDNEIYYVKNNAVDSACMHPKYFQFLIPDRTIHVTAVEELEQIPDENVIVLVEPADEETAGFLEGNADAELIDESWLFKAYVMEEK